MAHIDRFRFISGYFGLAKIHSPNRRDVSRFDPFHDVGEVFVCWEDITGFFGVIND